MGFIILRFWDWCCKSKGIRKETEYDLTNILKVLLEWVKLSLEQSKHHTRQLTVTNPFFITMTTKNDEPPTKAHSACRN